MIDKVQVEDCCLCQACSNICPVNAIQFSVQYKDFKYPLIDDNKCIQCNKCERVCPSLTKLQQNNEEFPAIYAARSKDKDIRLQSTSGGIFYEMACLVLKQGGYVCGAICDEECNIYHVLTNKIEIVEKMRGSKYAQSDTASIYRLIEEKLEENKQVLFCGCPCQVVALKRYLKNDYENLITADFVCHGIPSNDVLKKYLRFLEMKYNSKIRYWSLRDKTNGWHSSSVKVEFENGKTYLEPITVDAYMRSFLSGVTMKESCYTCKYKYPRIYSDISMGDFWGAEAVFSEIDDNTGLSSILVHSKKGMKVLNDLEIDCSVTDFNTIVKYNKNIIEPTKISSIRNQFYEYADKYGIEYAIKEFFEETRVQKLTRKTRYMIRCIYYKICGRGKPLY